MGFHKRPVYLQQGLGGRGSYYSVLIMSRLAFPFTDSPPLGKTDNPTTTTTTSKKKAVQRLGGFEFLEYIIRSSDRISAQPLSHLGIPDTLDTITRSPIIHDFALITLVIISGASCSN